ncbi:MAG: ThiF family adenylyltransferase [Clostridia bacterium]|nr:ThiF family adenylyltransferase [Clostridia bacterium]
MNEKAQVQGYDISANSAAVIGCGGLGTNVAVHLAGAGIGKLWLCDFDTVQTRNLNRQFFYTPQDVGNAKCLLLAERLRAFSPETEITPVQKRILSPKDLDFARDAELVILAVDNIDARKVTAGWCEQTGKPAVNGGVDGAYGTAYLFVPGKTASLESAGALAVPKTKPQSQSPVVGIIGALEAKLAVDYFLNNTASQGVLLCFDGLEIQKLPLKYGKGADAT